MRRKCDALALCVNQFFGGNASDGNIVLQNGADGSASIRIGVVNQNDGNICGPRGRHIFGGILHGAQQDACYLHANQRANQFMLPFEV